MSRLIQDARFALRVFRRAPGFALAAALTLAVGIGANTSIFSARLHIREMRVIRPSEIGRRATAARVLGG
jgi:hypothetical protein